MRRRVLATAFMICALLALLLPAASAGADAEPTIGTIVGNRVAMRRQPSSDSASLRRLDAGERVTILESNVNAEWYRVQAGGDTGYINRMYVDISASLPSYRSAGAGTVTNCESFINVRAEASVGSERLGTAEKGAVLSVTQAYVSAGWHQIDYNGTAGYVSADYIDFQQQAEDDQLVSLSVTGGTLSPSFSPSEYGYILTATAGQVTVTAKANDGVKVSVGNTGIGTAKYTINEGNSKTIRISVGGKVRYSIYLVRDVITVGTWNIKRGNENLVMQGWLIGNQQPDIMGIQEVYVGRSNRETVNNLLSLRTRDMQNTSFAPTIDYDDGQYGVGQISAFEPVSSEQFELPQGSSKEPRTLQKVVYTVNSRTVSVYNTHFSYESASIRKQQFSKVLEIMDADTNDYKILTGDFNAAESEFSAFTRNYKIVNSSSTKFYDYSGKRISMNQIDNI
ncbi:MAG: SH3 domain-containing protein, partial [Clostridia bacterium]|nr:SH3 domain-containing protein [Clostridia bacterium]